MARAYREIRKDYILSRTDTILRTPGNRGNRRSAKEQACFEFDELVEAERQAAVKEALLRLSNEQNVDDGHPR